MLDDCVPSKTFISSAGVRVQPRRAAEPGIEADQDAARVARARINQRVTALAMAQSADVRARLRREGVRLLAGTASFVGQPSPGAVHTITVTSPDGARILTWRQLCDLDEPPEHLVVVGSGVARARRVDVS